MCRSARPATDGAASRTRDGNAWHRQQPQGAGACRDRYVCRCVSQARSVGQGPVVCETMVAVLPLPGRDGLASLAHEYPRSGRCWRPHVPSVARQRADPSSALQPAHCWCDCMPASDPSPAVSSCQRHRPDDFRKSRRAGLHFVSASVLG